MKILTLLVFVAIISCILAVNEGYPCVEDSDCQSLNSCVSGKCKHKALFPIKVSEVFASLWIALLNSISSAAGLSFGGSTVPYFQIFMHYSQTNAISLAYLITFGGGLGNLSNIMRFKHKETGGPIIHYNIALIAVPALTFGSQIGVTIRRVIPNLAQALILLVLLLYGTYNYWKKFRSQYKSEKAKFRKLKELETDHKDSERTEVPKVKETPEKVVDPAPKKHLRTPVEIEYESKTANEATAVKSKQTDNELAAVDVEVHNTEAKETNDTHDAAWHAKRDFLLKRELQLIPWFKLKEIFLIVVLIFVLVIIRGGKGVSSVAGVVYCSSMDAGMLAIQCAAYFICLVRNIYLIQGWENEKKKYNIVSHPDFIKIEGKTLIRFAATCIFAGIVGAIASLGGGTVIIPELFRLGLNPMITAYSAGAFTMFTTFNSAVQTYFAGTIVWQQILWLCSLAFVFSWMSSKLINYIFKKTGRQAFLPGIIFVVFVVAFIATLVLLIIECVENWDNVIAAKKYCS